MSTNRINFYLEMQNPEYVSPLVANKAQLVNKMSYAYCELKIERILEMSPNGVVRGSDEARLVSALIEALHYYPQVAIDALVKYGSTYPFVHSLLVAMKETPHLNDDQIKEIITKMKPEFIKIAYDQAKYLHRYELERYFVTKLLPLFNQIIYRDKETQVTIQNESASRYRPW